MLNVNYSTPYMVTTQIEIVSSYKASKVFILVFRTNFRAYSGIGRRHLSNLCVFDVVIKQIGLPEALNHLVKCNDSVYIQGYLQWIKGRL